MGDSKKDTDKKNMDSKYKKMSGEGVSNAALTAIATICPRCSSSFLCNASDIENCQCWGVKLGLAEFDYLKQQGFSVNEVGCFCRDCLLEIKTKISAEAPRIL